MEYATITGHIFGKVLDYVISYLHRIPNRIQTMDTVDTYCK